MLEVPEFDASDFFSWFPVPVELPPDPEVEELLCWLSVPVPVPLPAAVLDPLLPEVELLLEFLWSCFN